MKKPEVKLERLEDLKLPADITQLNGKSAKRLKQCAHKLKSAVEDKCSCKDKKCDGSCDDTATT